MVNHVEIEERPKSRTTDKEYKMINFFKKLKNKIYYSYIDKVVNSDSAIERSVKLESHEIVVNIEPEKPIDKVSIETPVLKQDTPLKPVAKKAGRPKGTVSKDPAKKAPVKKQAPKK